jgi:homoprotocatechuate degradation regulator HpaR
MTTIRKLMPYDQSLARHIMGAEEAVLAPMRPKLREYNITEPQWRVLRVLNDRGRTDATTLAQGGLLHAPSVTRILKELEERKLVLREPDTKDRRRTHVDLSPEGREVVKDVSRFVLRIIREYTKRFGAERMDNLANELRALTAAIQGVK